MQYKKKFINDKILEAGLNEYLDKGFRAGNISTIASNAGVPVGNLYRYFDGKSGLLDALVKPAYLELPKSISKIASLYDLKDGITENAVNVIASELVDLFNEYGKEIIILADKCATTRYDDFAYNTVNLMESIVENKLYPDANESDKIMAGVIAKALAEALFDILKMNLEPSLMETSIKRVLKYFFFEMSKRK